MLRLLRVMKITTNMMNIKTIGPTTAPAIQALPGLLARGEDVAIGTDVGVTAARVAGKLAAKGFLANTYSGKCLSA